MMEFENPTPANQNSACSKSGETSQNFKFERDDWMLFRSLASLPQKAGVPISNMRRLVLKELVDNSLDALGNASGGKVSIRFDPTGGCYIIEDNGPGIDGDAEDIATLFSISRPLSSTKMWRLPSRGALGNGIRVAVGAVLASGGSLVVTTRNQRHVLVPRHLDGRTVVASMPADYPIGTRIEIAFGDALPADGNAMAWADLAIRASKGSVYSGKSSPYWYDADHFHELLIAAGGRPVRMLVEQLDGCSGAKAGKISDAFRGVPCAGMSREQSIALLGAARSHSKQVNPRRLGAIGPDVFEGAYAIERGTAETGSHEPKADIPFVVEAWADLRELDGKHVDVDLMVNRTPATGEINAQKHKTEIAMFGMGIQHYIAKAPGSYSIIINITAPHIPITTDGKEPDLTVFREAIQEAVGRAVKKARRSVPKPIKRSQKDIVLSRLNDAISRASGAGKYMFSMRNLYYAVRPYVMEEVGTGLTYGNFTNIITDYESDHGDINGMFRDDRGKLYHPHLESEIPLGTKSVAAYERPEWRFNKVLYIEKEGFFEALRAAKWPERHDCALMSSKGFSGRAARDLIDMLAEDTVETVTVFCVHDADASGTMIYQSLQEATRARGRRKIEIINLGLEPWEGQDMDLDREDRESLSSAPVAEYIKERPDGAQWEQWLQSYRYELNAMPTPQLIEWLDRKMAEHDGKKVQPPVKFALDYIRDTAEESARSRLTAEILEEAGLEDRVDEAMIEIELPAAEEINVALPAFLADNPTEEWRRWARLKASELANPIMT